MTLLPSPTTDEYPLVAHGAMGYVLEYIQMMTARGRCDFSYVEICLGTGYSIPTIQRTVGELERARFIKVIRGGAGKPNRYTVLDNSTRRTVLVARFVGLIQ